MDRLEDITLSELHELREQTEGEIPRERVLAAIGRKQGDEIETLAERHGVVEKTIRNWLDRFEDGPLEEAPYDDSRPGRPPRLEADQRERLFEHLRTAPTALGYEQQAWSPALLRCHVSDEFGVEYSKGHARRLLNTAELSSEGTAPSSER